jgi:hypothetical protein
MRRIRRKELYYISSISLINIQNVCVCIYIIMKIIFLVVDESIGAFDHSLP